MSSASKEICIRGKSSCLICNNSIAKNLINNLGYVNYCKLIFETDEFNLLLEGSKVCLNCVGRIHQLFDFDLIRRNKNEIMQRVETEQDVPVNCFFCPEEQESKFVLGYENTADVNEAIEKTKWVQEFKSSDVICHSCYNFLHYFLYLKNILAAENDLFIPRLNRWKVVISKDEKELALAKYNADQVHERSATPTGVNVSSECISSSNDEDKNQAEQPVQRSKKRKQSFLTNDEEPMKTKLEKQKPLNMNRSETPDINCNNLGAVDKFEMIKIRRSSARPIVLTPANRKRSTPLPNVAVKEEIDVEKDTTVVVNSIPEVPSVMLDVQNLIDPIKFEMTPNINQEENEDECKANEVDETSSPADISISSDSDLQQPSMKDLPALNDGLSKNSSLNNDGMFDIEVISIIEDSYLESSNYVEINYDTSMFPHLDLPEDEEAFQSAPDSPLHELCVPKTIEDYAKDYSLKPIKITLDRLSDDYVMKITNGRVPRGKRKRYCPLKLRNIDSTKTTHIKVKQKIIPKTYEKKKQQKNHQQKDWDIPLSESLLTLADMGITEDYIDLEGLTLDQIIDSPTVQTAQSPDVQPLQKDIAPTTPSLTKAKIDNEVPGHGIAQQPSLVQRKLFDVPLKFPECPKPNVIANSLNKVKQRQRSLLTLTDGTTGHQSPPKQSVRHPIQTLQRPQPFLQPRLQRSSNWKPSTQPTDTKKRKLEDNGTETVHIQFLSPKRQGYDVSFIQDIQVNLIETIQTQNQ